MTSRWIIKIGAAAMAFVPGSVLITSRSGMHTNPTVLKGAEIFNYPAFTMTLMAEGLFHPSKWVLSVILVSSLLLWAALVATLFWKAAAFFLGEEEPEARQKFDWIAFQVRFVLGFVVGFLVGWRFVKNSDGKTILISMIITGVIGGLICGASRGNFWSR